MTIAHKIPPAIQIEKISLKKSVISETPVCHFNEAIPKSLTRTKRLDSRRRKPFASCLRKPIYAKHLFLKRNIRKNPAISQV